jgi:hypothetical protein
MTLGTKQARIMSQPDITEYCVYTIVDGKKLGRIAKEGLSRHPCL